MYKIVLIILVSMNILLNASEFLPLKDACHKGKMDSCYRLGKMFSAGEEVRHDFVEARKYYEKACAKKHAKACIKLGSLYLRGLGVTKDIKKGKQYYQDVCNRGKGIGCYTLAEYYGQHGNYKKAISLYDLACTKNYAYGCSYNASAYGFPYHGFVKDLQKAGSYAKKACQLEKKYCSEVGEMYGKGKFGVSKDILKAKDQYLQSCQDGGSVGCYRLGDLYYTGQGVKKSYTKAKSYYTQSCKLKNYYGCYKLGNLYYKGQSVKQSYKMAKIYYDKACCNMEPDTSYCFGVGEACNNKAILYRYGKGVKKNIKLASKYYFEACAKGYKKACTDFEILQKKIR